ncbi:RNA-directed DNA polymerase, eukaryota, reverse transcriptase zinc-binding domain protein [Tanacetum coccineum]|uniref:RNA-directed DNA polymerase, eukaryota, reverse transcriptase zinc-binding domain protein n=1 Tax=Tanacetum coccineum TaxID=301880 RepID=A0ABQ5D7W6_9ASTR
MAHKLNGDLGVNSLYALNLALLFKWIWRFLSSHSGLWYNVIKVVHGINGSLNSSFRSNSHGSVWIGMLKAIAKLKSKEKIHRLYNLETQKDVSVAHKLQCHDLASSFRRPPRSVWIDNHVLATSSSPTRWSKILPIKVNVFLWRMFLDRLPTRSNLSNRGLDIPCTLCPNCGIGVESRNHLFFGCSMALVLFRMLGRWWSIQVPVFEDPDAWSTWFNGLNLSSLQKIVLEASIFSLWWHI